MCGPLNLDALGSQIRDHNVDAALLNGAQAPRAHAQADETLLGFQPKSVAMQIGQKAAALAIVRVRYRITRFGTFARDLADSRHGSTFENGSVDRAALYTRVDTLRQ
jgi:hypothetical protein